MICDREENIDYSILVMDEYYISPK